MMSAAEVTSRTLRAAEEAPRNKQRLCLGVRLSDSVAHMYWTRASCDRRRLYDSEIKFLSKAYTNPKTLTAGIQTLNDRHGAFVTVRAGTAYLEMKLTKV